MALERDGLIQAVVPDVGHPVWIRRRVYHRGWGKWSVCSWQDRTAMRGDRAISELAWYHAKKAGGWVEVRRDGSPAGRRTERVGRERVPAAVREDWRALWRRNWETVAGDGAAEKPKS